MPSKSREAEPHPSPALSAIVPPLAIGLGAFVALGGAWWVRSRWRETSLNERTRDRLSPRRPRQVVPSAADIRVV